MGTTIPMQSTIPMSPSWKDLRESQGKGTVFEHGEVKVVTRVVGYKKIKFYTLENLGYGKIELPDLQFHTTSYWITFKRSLLERLPYHRLEVIDGVLGLGYALHSMAALHLMCDPHDLNRCVGDRGAKWFLRLSRGSKGIYSSFDGRKRFQRKGWISLSPRSSSTTTIREGWVSAINSSMTPDAS